MKPPPIICNSRVLEYAETGDSVFTGKLQLYVDGARLGAVPCLAICESFSSDELLLFHCDADWEVIGIQAWSKSEAAEGSPVEWVKSRAENYYAGISSRWIAHDASDEEVKAYQDYLVGDDRCSHCSRTIFEVDSLVESNGGALICNLCVATFQKDMTTN